MIVTFAFGYITDGGELTNADGTRKALCDFSIGCDPSFGRLANTDKYPVFEPQWYHALPPFMLLILTRFGVPVSTTFMVLTIFATLGGLSSMLQKSLIGYGLAFLVGGILYAILSQTLERYFRATEDKQTRANLGNPAVDSDCLSVGCVVDARLCQYLHIPTARRWRYTGLRSQPGRGHFSRKRHTPFCWAIPSSTKGGRCSAF